MTCWNLKNLFWFDYWVVVLKIFTLFFTCKDFLIACLLWISYHILYLVSNTNNQVTELHDKRMMLNKYVCHTRQKKRCYRAEFKRRTMPSCTWMILGLVMHKGNNIPTLTAWNDDWNWPWSKISSQACHWKLLHNCVTDVKEHTWDECALRIRISCSYNWCAVLMLPGIKQDELQGVLRHCSTHLNGISDLYSPFVQLNAGALTVSAFNWRKTVLRSRF